MKVIISIIIVVLTLILFAEAASGIRVAERNLFQIEHRGMREFITVFEEDFETGAEDWEYYDATGVSDWIENWHLSTVGSYLGNSWWMGDEELGGYTNHRYLVLDTPELTLSVVNPELHFMFSLCCEDSGGGAEYDGWDGANVRISTDGGASWTPIMGTPAYNAASIYSYGYEFSEGMGIPGWCSTTQWLNWTESVFDLSAYSGESVRIRFAFASDPAYCTEDDDSMFGFRIDNIEISTSEGTFESDGDGVAGDEVMAAGYGCTATGDLWHVYEDIEAPSGSHAMGCFDEVSNSYNPRMEDYIVTPTFYLPPEGTFTWDVYVRTMFDDDSTFPDCDYLLVEVSSQFSPGYWTDWFPVSCPTGIGSPHVYNGNFENWTLFTDAWGDNYADLSELAGREVKMRFGLHSNEINEAVPGGIRIDDFSVLQEVFLGPPPLNLVAIENDDNQIELTWDPPSEGGSEGWIQWDNGENYDAIGLTNGGTIYCAASFDQIDMMPYVGGQITQVELFINDLPSSITLHIWEGNDAGTEVLSQTFTAAGADWVTIDLDTPVTIESVTEYWIGYEVTQTAGQFCCGVDAGPAIVGKGDWIATSPGAWQSMAGMGLDYNWNIHAYVDAGERRLPLFARASRDREITGYNIWRSNVSGEDYFNIGTIDPSDTPAFIDEDPLADDWNYYVVTALYDGLDGAYSNEATTYIIDEQLELAYDDGSCEEGANVGIAQYMAVKFTPLCNYIRTISHLKLYIETHNTGYHVFRILEGSTGQPGEMLAQFDIPSANLHVGWNIIEFPEVTIPDSTSDCFFISIFEMANTSAIGKDTDSAGHSWITSGEDHTWSEMTDGNLMIRTFIYPLESSDPIEIVPAIDCISCYPNPFNPELTIAFFTTETTESTEINIYNVKGQKVKSLVNAVLSAGEHSVVWQGKDDKGRQVSSGLYLVRADIGGREVTEKALLLK